MQYLKRNGLKASEARSIYEFFRPHGVLLRIFYRPMHGPLTLTQSRFSCLSASGTVCGFACGCTAVEQRLGDGSSSPAFDANLFQNLDLGKRLGRGRKSWLYNMVPVLLTKQISLGEKSEPFQTRSTVWTYFAHPNLMFSANSNRFHKKTRLIPRKGDRSVNGPGHYARGKMAYCVCGFFYPL